MKRTITYQITAENANIRIEQFLRRKFYSRQNLAQLKNADGSTQLNGKACRLNQRLSPGDILEVHISEDACSEQIPATALPLFNARPDVKRPGTDYGSAMPGTKRPNTGNELCCQPQGEGISIVYEDEDILVIDKPAGLPMHPSRDNYYYSLANAVMHYYRNSGGFVFRCTNRLDRDTSGLTVIAKHSVSASVLGAMQKESGYDVGNACGCGSDGISNSASDCSSGNHPARNLVSLSRPYMERRYLAIVCGTPSPASGTIDAPISRKQPQETYQKHTSIERQVDFEHGERAVTHYHVLETKNGCSLVSVLLGTGRTHQIRVHMAYLGHPLAGDYLYNPDCRRAAVQTYLELPAALISDDKDTPEHFREPIRIPSVSVPIGINGISRQALHACRLKFHHPITGELMEFHSPLPEDMRRFGFQQR
ncbi:MAG: RluA family pseudouridine synthase [Clostridiales bacterium]|nr:RluA family pseudouridine synthase [Clostridiales bacterium]